MQMTWETYLSLPDSLTRDMNGQVQVKTGKGWEPVIIVDIHGKPIQIAFN